jgi:Tfp pilus assembly protein PilV
LFGIPLPVSAPRVPTLPLPVVVLLLVLGLLGMLGVPASRSRSSFFAESQHLKLLSAALGADCAKTGPVVKASKAAPATSESFIKAPFDLVGERGRHK